MKRRNFLKSASLTGLGFAVAPVIASCTTEDKKEKKPEEEDEEDSIFIRKTAKEEGDGLQWLEQ